MNEGERRTRCFVSGLHTKAFSLCVMCEVNRAGSLVSCIFIRFWGVLF